MIQATTPTIIMTLPNTVDLTLVDQLVFTLLQQRSRIVKTGDALVVDGQTVSVYLTQEDTIRLSTGAAQIQLNWTYNDGSRAATNIVNINVDPNLYLEVIG